MVNEIGRHLLDRWIYVMVKVDTEFLTPYTGDGRDRILAGGYYPPSFGPFLVRFLEAMRAPWWPPGSYYPGGWFRVLAAAGQDPLAVAITPEALRPFTLGEVVVDKDGNWFVGPKKISGRVLAHFLRNLSFDEGLGRYAIHYKLERDFETRYLHHHSPPFRVRRLTFRNGTAELSLNDGSHEPLRPETLRLDRHERLYCAVKPEQVPAWFENEARWSLLKDAEERGGHLVVSLDGRAVELPPSGNSWPYADKLPD